MERHVKVGALHCDGYHEVSDLGAVSEPHHGSLDGIEPVCPHQRLDGAGSGLTERDHEQHQRHFS